MKPHHILKSSLIVAILCFQTTLAKADSMVVFGDSLSDIGNLASVPGQGPFPPPFYLGSRVSNGPVAVEVAAALAGDDLQPSLHLVGGEGGLNFAVAGARAAGTSPIDLSTQVGAFLLPRGGIAPEDKTYVVFIGGNDIRDARDASGRESYEIVRKAVSSIEQQLTLLVGAGAKALMVVSAPDIGIIPETLKNAVDREGRRAKYRASWLTYVFNRRLERAVNRIERIADIDMVLLDINDIFDNIIDDAAARGITNTTEACLDTRTFQFNDDCGFGANFDQFVFFDQIHPTAKSHAIAGRVIYAYLPSPPSVTITPQ
ncbi:MAG: SGNH/GDSL hydrolase family protein [Acidiferrobacterales bacterium]|nr:SGNH/GDSL hydrolase family protein [Acidiferrobacterales bacterium]